MRVVLFGVEDEVEFTNAAGILLVSSLFVTSEVNQDAYVLGDAMVVEFLVRNNRRFSAVSCLLSPARSGETARCLSLTLHTFPLAVGLDTCFSRLDQPITHLRGTHTHTQQYMHIDTHCKARSSSFLFSTSEGFSAHGSRTTRGLLSFRGSTAANLLHVGTLVAHTVDHHAHKYT